jgi:DNA-binding MarR family transcriptional regulator
MTRGRQRRDTLADEDLVESWGHVVEGYTSVMEQMSRDIEEASGLPAKAFEVLLRLSRTPGRQLPLTELATSVSFSSSGFTRLADRLEAGHLIRREPCPTDRRVTFAVLTDAGAAQLDKALVAHLDGLRRYVLDRIGEEPTRQLASTMRQLRTSVDHGRGLDSA